MRYPRDKAPAEPRPPAGITAVPYGSWEQLRPGKDVAILAVGTMVQPAQQAADLLAPDGIDCEVVNCRFLKPLDHAMLESLLQRAPHHRHGGGGHHRERLRRVPRGDRADDLPRSPGRRARRSRPADRAGAARAEQLELFGLTAAGIARRITALQHEESLEAR